MSLLTAAGMFLMAALYSHAGHSGSLGYLAILLLYGMPALYMKPTALLLGIPVALIATLRSFRGGFFSWRTFWPFAVGSVPMVFLAAGIRLRPFYYFLIIALVLVYGALRLFIGFGSLNEKKTTVVPIWIALPAGAAIGLIAGFAGVGGAVFLVPLLLLMRWAKTNEAIAVAAPFALINLAIALALSNPTFPLMIGNLIYWAPATLIGAWIGTEVQMSPVIVAQMSRLLSAFLLVAALRLIPTLI